MSKKGKNFEISDFYCTKCGRKGIPIARINGKFREAGHLKKIWCMYCNEETNHAEIKPYGNYTVEKFREEFELGRFVNGTKEAIADLVGCSKIDCEYNRHGKCWNSDNSVQCGHKIILTNPNDETKNLLNRGQ